MKVRITPSAEADLLAAAEFYDEQSPGLGEEVINFLHTEILQLQGTAGIHRKVRSFHLYVVQGRFPYYVIYYRLHESEAVVQAVLDHRRDPKLIRRTLRQRS